jgi:putative oxidoreductase
MKDNSQRDLFAPILGSDALMGLFLLTARLFTTGIFVFYIDEIVKMHAPSGLVYLAIAVYFVGIVLVALGYKTRLAALLLAVCIITTLLFRTGVVYRNGTVLKDLAISAGFVFMFAYGPGPLSLDTYRGHGKPGWMEDNSFFSPMLSNNAVVGPLLCVGRILSTLVFFIYGIFKVFHAPQTQAYMMRHHIPPTLIYLAILTELVFPVLVLLGYKTRYGALALAGFCIIATSLFHAEFGNHAEAEQFVLDFAIAGGFLFMFAQGPGPISLDALRGPSKPAGETKEALSKGS